MAQERVSKPIAERRCPNCGTRVARDAESCFMCGYDLRREPRRRRQVSWVDALLVLAVLFVIGFWWQAGSRPSVESAETPTAAAGIPPEQIPFLTSTPTPTPTATPSVEAPAAPDAPSGTLDHTVVAGETLLSIALDYGVTVDEIRQTNNLTGDLIGIGDKLTIPGQQAVLAPTAGGTAAPRGPVSTFQYTVQEGDTIVSIATRLGSSVDEILQANNLGRSDLIRPGDQLNIPVRQVPQEVLESTVVTTTSAGTSSAAPTAASSDYPRPQLTAPADGAIVNASEAVLLRWVSVDLLAPNEWYVVLLYPQSPGARRFPSIWTKTTSYRLGTEYAPEAGQSADYSWQVSVVRVTSPDAGGYALEAASPASELRGFVWK